MKLILSNDQSKFYQLQGRMIELTTQERMSYAAKKFFLFFGLALISVFIPVAHFVLVPVFLLLAFITGFKSYGIQSRLELGQKYLCHQCQTELKPSYMLGQDARIKCEKCFAQYAIEMDSN